MINTRKETFQLCIKGKTTITRTQRRFEVEQTCVAKLKQNEIFLSYLQQPLRSDIINNISRFYATIDVGEVNEGSMRS